MRIRYDPENVKRGRHPGKVAVGGRHPGKVAVAGNKADSAGNQMAGFALTGVAVTTSRGSGITPRFGPRT